MQGTIGEVRMFGGNFAPRTWAFCDGQLLAISSNTALFSIIGTLYGGDGRTTFKLPDMRGRSCLQQGTGPGLTHRSIASRGGAESTTLVLSQLPVHSHLFAKEDITLTSKPRAYNDEANTEEPDGAYPALVGGKNVYASQQDAFGVAARVTFTNTLATTSSGSNQSYDNHSPYQGVNYIICLQGIFPSRN